MLCRKLGLFVESLVAIDGRKFKTVNNRDRKLTSAKSCINRYLTALDTADRREPTVAKAKSERLQDKITTLNEPMKALKEIEVRLNKTADKQISLTDPYARENKRGRYCWL